ncbi:acetyl esterase [Symmachiella macrocystis]|uniref:Acetyl esterase n=1 Tax=Symmachiella macrocystis TaxID=2527985 RepID=A0A5C6BBC9_9PLAN|nr:alpha/beta hydrolase [Symmachiella macrocystis]TWU08982.1 acetyl esterase [Symmachiella macrocystis]
MRSFIALCLLLVPTIALADDSGLSITPDVVYGHKDGLALTFDVFTPTHDANGVGILFMVSGGWYSHWAPPEQMQGLFKPLTDKGFTVFAVRHGSSPRYGIPDAVSDVRRSVRFIRKNAGKYKIDPNRLGVFGMSAGGHLSLILGTTADEGNPDDKDPVGRISDRVQAVVAFVAPTDLTIMVKDYPQRLPAYANFPALDLGMKEAESHSPLRYVTPDDAPTLLLAGAKDDLVPIDHSRKIQAEFDAKKIPNQLIEFENSGHGFTPDDMQRSVAEMATWFEKHLAKQ